MSRKVAVMNTTAAAVVSLVSLFAAHGSAGAQGLFEPEPAPPTTSSECAYTFGNEGFTWCVSVNGNVVALTSPARTEHIRVGNVSEGYVVCAADAEPYFDVGTQAAGWDPATLIGKVGPVNVSLERTTVDGRFRLRHDIFGISKLRSIIVVMTVTNLLGDATAV